MVKYLYGKMIVSWWLYKLVFALYIIYVKLFESFMLLCQVRSSEISS